MRNNVVGKVSIATSKKKRARFNLSHDVNTTSSWGETQPLQCRLMIPDSKATYQKETLVRLAPMVAPTFGRVKAKSWDCFVPIADLMHNFPSLLAQEPVTRGTDTFKPTTVPSIPLNVLSTLVLIGSRVTVYKRSANDVIVSGVSYGDLTLYRGVSDNSWLERWRPYYSDGSDDFVKQCFNGFSDSVFDFGLILNSRFTPSSNLSLRLPIGTGVTDTMEDLVDSGKQVNGAFVSNNDYVSLDGADYVKSVFFTDDGSQWLMAFKLSDFGKRIRKILLGCGYQIDFDNSSYVSVLPLFAYYKAYFDVFGLTLYNAWETTNAASVLTYCDFHNFWRFEAFFPVPFTGNIQDSDSIKVKFWSFIYDLGNCFVTDAVDYVSAHIGSTAVSPGADALTGRFIDVNGLGANVNAAMNSEEIPEANSNRNAHAFINSVLHGQLDSEVLKRLYKWTNRNTVAGRRLAELLRAQGLGKFVEECKSNFIGFDEIPITISDVVSTSDTFSKNVADSGVGAGAVLGEYGGRGLQYDKAKSLTFEASEYGYWITLFAIVPEAGYCQALDKSLECTTKFDFYNPEFDGLGFEASSKANVVGASDVSVLPKDGSNPSSPGLIGTFGFVPRYTGLKIANNIMNGDFNLRSVRDVYLPYSLDRIFEVNKLISKSYSNGTGPTKESILFIIANKAADIPIAGDVWRYNSRYPWFGNYNRIFANLGNEQDLFNPSDRFVSNFEISSSSNDNFLVHNVLNIQSYAPMLPISDSFETDDDGRTDVSIEKA